MVSLGLDEERGTIPAPKSMAMGPKRSKPLHNFTFPCLKWGSQRYLRCMKVATDGADVSPTSEDRRSPPSKSGDSTVIRKRRSEPDMKQPAANARDSEKRIKISKSGIAGDVGIEAMREKLMLDLKNAANRMKDAILRTEVAKEYENEDVEGGSPPAAAAEAEVRPWNLRKRQAPCKTPVAGDSGNGLKTDEKKPNYSPLRTSPPKLRGNSEETQRAKISVPLSKKEIEEDFMELLGHRPPRRPKKRPRNVQKQLDCLFPGLWLTEVTADLYKVSEDPDNGKR